MMSRVLATWYATLFLAGALLAVLVYVLALLVVMHGIVWVLTNWY